MGDSSERSASDSYEQPSPAFPKHGALIGLDYGTKRIGIAISTRDQTIASPLENYTRRRDDQDGSYLAALAQDYDVVGLVVGLPVHLSGDEGEKAQEAREFARWVGQVTGLPICLWDERFTTSQAERSLRDANLTRQQRKSRLDKVAAQIMLQTFLDRRPERPANPGSE